MASIAAPPITPAQCRAARALLDLSVVRLAGLAVVPRVIVEEFEAAGAPLSQADLEALRRALEQAGVVFIDPNGGGPGVRLSESD
ncbi:MAG: transcriptional regulator [Alphaproteobacteria bacterium]|nr:transcriptional regulator [Alphaproteobacteria bacterium]